MKTTKKNLNKTLWADPKELEKDREYYKIDADGEILGKIAVKAARYLMGKHKPYYSDAWDAGDFIIIENVEKVKVTGKKMDQKMYRTHSGYKWNMKEISMKNMMEKDPTRIIKRAVKGMLPKNKLRKKRLKRLKLFVGETDKYEYLSPEELNIND